MGYVRDQASIWIHGTLRSWNLCPVKQCHLSSRRCRDDYSHASSRCACYRLSQMQWNLRARLYSPLVRHQASKRHQMARRTLSYSLDSYNLHSPCGQVQRFARMTDLSAIHKLFGEFLHSGPTYLHLCGRLNPVAYCFEILASIETLIKW